MTIDAKVEAILANQEAQAQRDREIAERLERIERKLAPTLATVEQAAEAWGVCVASVQRWARKGRIRAVRVGRSWRIDIAAVRPPTDIEIAEAAADARETR